MAVADTYAALVLQDKPQAFWKMDDTTGFPQDSSGNGRHVSNWVVSPPAAGDYRRPGPYGGMFGLRMDDSTSAIASLVSTATDNITFEMWIQPSSLNFVGNNPVYRNGTASGSSGASVCFIADNLFSCGFKARAGSTLQAAGAPIAGVNWYYIVVVRSNTVWQYYRNGLVDVENAGTTAPPTPTSGTFIGPDSAGCIFTYSNVAYYNKALPASTVFARYRAMTSLPDPELRSTPPHGWGAA